MRIPLFGHFRALAENSYIFIIEGPEPKLFDFRSISQQQSCKAHEIGQLCQQQKNSHKQLFTISQTYLFYTILFKIAMKTWKSKVAFNCIPLLQLSGSLNETKRGPRKLEKQDTISGKNIKPTIKDINTKYQNI